MCGGSRHPSPRLLAIPAPPNSEPPPPPLPTPSYPAPSTPSEPRPSPREVFLLGPRALQVFLGLLLPERGGGAVCPGAGVRTPTPGPAELARAPDTAGSKDRGHPQTAAAPTAGRRPRSPLLGGLHGHRQRGHGSNSLSFLVLTLLGLDQGVAGGGGEPLQGAPVLACGSGGATAQIGNRNPEHGPMGLKQHPSLATSKHHTPQRQKPRGGLVRNSQIMGVWKSFLVARRTGPFRGRTPGWRWAPRRVPPSGWGGWDRHFRTPSWSPEMMGGGAGSLLGTPGPRAPHPGGQELSAQQGDPGSHPRTRTLMTGPPRRPRMWAGRKSPAVCSLLGRAPRGAGLVSGPRVLRTDGVGFAGPRAEARPEDTGFRVGLGLSSESLKKGPHPPEPQLFHPTEQSW